MIIWVNGPFGGGKTTLVEEIMRLRPDAVVLDPEQIGHFLRATLPAPIDDFQDLPSWRELVVAAVLSVQRHHADLLLVPMTLIEETYRREVLGALRRAGADLFEVYLDVPAQELRRRITQQVLFADDPDLDADAREFRLSKVNDGVAAAARVARDALVLDAGNTSPGELAQTVLDRSAATR